MGNSVEGFAVIQKDAVCFPNEVNSDTKSICGNKHYVDSKKQFLEDPYHIYATFLKDDVFNHIAFAEYHTSAQEKFTAARRRYGRLHHRSVWLLFNVHLGDVQSTCGADAFGVIKWFCKYYRDIGSCGP